MVPNAVAPCNIWDVHKPGNPIRATWLGYAGIQVYLMQSPCSLLSSSLPRKISPTQWQWAVTYILCRKTTDDNRVHQPFL